MASKYKTAAIRLLALFCILIFANDAQASVSSVGILDNALSRYSAAASSWATIITSRASWIFWLLVLLSMVWTFGMMALRRADLGEFFAEFIRFTIFTGFFWWLLINGPAFAESIINSLKQIGGEATGLSPHLYPSGIVDIGFAIFDKVINNTSVWSPAISTAGIIIGLIILVVLALVGINMLLLLISGWILAYAGVFFLGFGGARWTSDIAINYYKTVLGVAAQLMTMILLVGIGSSFLNDYYAHVSAGGVRLKEMAVVLIAAIILLLLVEKVPALISGIITGASVHGMGIGSFGAGMAVGAAGMAGAAVATSAGMLKAGMGELGGGAQAIKSAFSAASANVASGNDILGGFFSGPSGGGKGGSGTSAGMTPLTQAMGIKPSPASTGPPVTGRHKSQSAVAKGFRVAADMPVHLAKGAAGAGKQKMGNFFAESKAGKIAAAIDKGQSEATPVFDGNGLGKADSEPFNPAAEVEAFVNREQTS
jgi:type IV secretion system protein TrbL